ncbi:MAG: ThiF family adenylyltransferase [Candidatus Atabeyarchaeum deiterrae]
MKRKQGGAREGRYSRQLLLENWKQEKLTASKVLVVGIGALGAAAATNLVALGVGEITLVDFDTVEISNLNRQVLFRESDIGKAKVTVAAKHLKELNSDIKINQYNQDMRVLPKGVYESPKAILDCLDSFEDKRWLNSVCVELKKPLIHGGMYGWYGNVQVVIPFKTPCLECQPLIPPERLEKACTPPGKRRREEEQAAATWQKQKIKKTKMPSISTVSTIIGGLQAQQTLKLIMGGEEASLQSNYLFYDGRTESITKLELQRNPNCIVCGEKYAVRTTEYAIDKDEDIRSLKDRLIMSWGLVEPIRAILNGQILQDNKKIGELHLGQGDALYVYDRSMYKPMRLALKVQ